MNLVDPPSLFKVSCPFNFGWYPFDKQVCNIRDKCASNYLGTFMNYKYTYLFKRNDNLLNTNNQARECAKHCRRAHRQRIGRENIPWYVPPYTWSYRFQYSVFWCNYQSFKKPRKKLSLFKISPFVQVNRTCFSTTLSTPTWPKTRRSCPSRDLTSPPLGSESWWTGAPCTSPWTSSPHPPSWSLSQWSGNPGNSWHEKFKLRERHIPG